MNSTHGPIAILAPLEEAFEIMQKILFRPFDLRKWFVIGFAAWIATFFSGGGFNYRWSGKNDWRTYYQGPHVSFHHPPPWVIPFLIGLGVVVLAVIVLLMWVNARGRFIFTDCIVRNRAAIVEPWREYRREGDRYFGLQLLVTLFSLGIGGALAVLFVFGVHFGTNVLPFPLLILLSVVFVLIAILLRVVMTFMVPVMYRRRCGAGEAFRDVLGLIGANAGSVLLFILCYLVIAIAAVMIGCLVGCVTCCVAMLPYVGTVILLPVVMVLFTYPLCYLRQFGDSYDAFAVVRPTETPATSEAPPPQPQQPPPPLPPSPPPVPPVQENPPSE